jgi:hypothetical protein
MSRLQPLSEWTNAVSTNFPKLSKPQVTILAAWSFAMVIAQSCATTSCGIVLANLWHKDEQATTQRLSEFCYDAKNKSGVKQKRRQLDVSTCFAPLLRWILSNWPATHTRLAFALDATLLADHCVVLSCSLLYRGCAIPVAWKVVSANKKGAWKPHWLQLIALLEGLVPQNWTVVVFSDRGLYARWLFRAIKEHGWHPFMRIQRQGLFQLPGESRWRDIRSVAPREEQQWSGEVLCYKGSNGRLSCTLLARWEAGQKEPWLVVTDLLPHEADCVWYGLRTWIECGFKDVKSGGWHWDQTKMRDPARIERHWLVIALATLWVVSIGGAAEENGIISGLEELPALEVGRKVRKGAGRARLVSCFRRGVLRLVCGLIAGTQGLMDVATFWPTEWPTEQQRGCLPRTDLNAPPPALLALPLSAAA